MLRKLLFALLLVAAPVVAQQNVNVFTIGGTKVTSTTFDTANNAIKINCVVGCTAGGSFADSGAFTFGTTAVSNTSFVVDDVATNTVAENSAGAARMTASRILMIRPTDGTNFMPTMDAAARRGFLSITDGTDTANVSAGGKLEVTCDNCGGSSFADNSAFTFGTTNITPIGGVLDDVATNAATENSAATPRISSNRMQLFQLGDGAGNERRANVDASNRLTVFSTLDQTGTGNDVDANITNATLAVTQSGTWTVQPGNTANTTAWLIKLSQTTSDNDVDVLTLPSVTVGTFPDNEPFNLAQWGGTTTTLGQKAMTASVPVVIASDQSNVGVSVNNTPTVAIGQTTTQNDVDVLTFPDNEPINIAQMNGAAVTMGEGASGTGVQRVTIANDSTGEVRIADDAGNQIASSTNGPLDAARGLVVRPALGCGSFVAISQTADTQVITGSAGQRIYICAITIIANAAETVSIVEGSGSVCASSPTALWGSTTEANGMSLAANGGFAMSSPAPFIRTSVDTNNLCILQVGTSRVTGMISYRVAAND